MTAEPRTTSRGGRQRAYSVLITSLDAGSVRQLSIPRWVITVGLAASAGIIALAGLGGAAISRTAAQREIIRELTAERDSLRTAFARVEQLESELAALATLGDRVREIAGVSATPSLERGSNRDTKQESPDRQLDHRPAAGPVSRAFGEPADDGRPHPGIDLAGAEGDSVFAAGAGRVASIDADTDYGNRIVIDHGNGLSTVYGHNRDVVPKVGDLVRSGQLIAHLGSTGRSSAPHLHFEVRQDGVPEDPVDRIARMGDRSREKK